MKFDETFTVPYPIEAVFRYFETEVPAVAACVPGLSDFEDLGEDHYRVKITQKIGSMGATFDLRARLDEKEPMAAFTFSAIGRSIKGAVGDLRSKNRLELASVPEGTELSLHADVVLGGLLGSLGYRAISAKASDVISEFVTNMTQAIAVWADEGSGAG